MSSSSGSRRWDNREADVNSRCSNTSPSRSKSYDSRGRDVRPIDPRNFEARGGLPRHHLTPSNISAGNCTQDAGLGNDDQRWLYPIELKLDTDRKDMRLIQITPGSEDAKLELRLVHFNLNGKWSLIDDAMIGKQRIPRSQIPTLPGYSALSYTWGRKGTKLKEISVNGHNFPITTNLWHALTEFRRREYRNL